jgi:hypothetical protein
MPLWQAWLETVRIARGGAHDWVERVNGENLEFISST